ncbi:recombinase family protein [Aeromicrobium sp. JJY06]|uniref:recombinase family protein n=1 Tax=Aeromicrobium sp. JJY06 TaxID=3373478 RepID=UPI00376EE6D0
MSKRAKRAVIYTRISRDDTGEGVANDRQREDCQKLADLRGWEVVPVDGKPSADDVSISGYSGKNRPAWNHVLHMIEAGEVDVVLAWHMDRMTRSMLDLEKLILLADVHGVGISTVHGDIDLTSDVGRMVARILAAVARAEVERKGARQKRANEQRARQGEFRSSGFRAFGYTLQGEVVEKEAALIREAAEEVLNGAPLRSIVRRWNDMRVPTPRSRKNMSGWTHNSVRSILLNPRNAAIATYNGEIVGKGKWEPLLSEETHILLVAMLNDPARTKGADQRELGNKPRNLLSGIATCGECGWKVEAGSAGGRKVYKCSNPYGDHLTTDRVGADQIIRSAITLAIGTTAPGTLTKPREKTVPADLWEERRRINDRLKKLTVSWAEGVLTDEMLKAGSESLKSQLEEVERRIESAASEPDDTDLRWEEARKFASLDLWAQRRVLTDLAEIKLWPKYRKRNVPLKQQVTVYLRGTYAYRGKRDGQGTGWSGTKPGATRVRLWPALDERSGSAPDPSAATYESLADVLVREQPDGVTTLSTAAQWLTQEGHTNLAPGGLPGKLSPLVRYVRGQTRGATGWTRKKMSAVRT